MKLTQDVVFLETTAAAVCMCHKETLYDISTRYAVRSFFLAKRGGP